VSRVTSSTVSSVPPVSTVLGTSPPRIVSIWFPDWPVTAAGFGPDVPAAVVWANRVIARTSAAATDGVVIGQRRRQAQRRCPQLMLVDRDVDRDAREFEPIVRAVAEISPRLDVIEPGWISLLARGPSRYFGGDRALADRLIELLAELSGGGPGERPNGRHGEQRDGRHGEQRAEQLGGPNADVVWPTVGIGVADGRFASSVAARLAVRRRNRDGRPGGEPVIVEAGASAAFCAELSIGWLQTLGECDAELVELFGRLGLRRLGDLAALPAVDVLGRFGHPGVHAHRLASGADVRPTSTTDPAPERRLDHVLDDPAAQSSAVVFIAKQLADELVGALAADGRVCTRLLVVLESEHGERSERSWYRSAGLSASAMVERVRWQLDAWIDLPKGSDQELTGGVVLVRLVPDEVRADDGMQLGLWGGQSEADRRAARAIARLTTLTSDDAVTVPVWHGGRLPADRYRWVSAATVDLDQRVRAVSAAGTGSGPTGPWPGTLPSPSPATVFADPYPAEVLDEHGEAVRVSARGMLSGRPTTLLLLAGDDATGWRRGRPRSIIAWAGPWPIEERWWEPGQHRRLARFQVVTDDHDGFLVVAEHQRWWISASYD
jgi:protein ImuB